MASVLSAIPIPVLPSKRPRVCTHAHAKLKCTAAQRLAKATARRAQAISRQILGLAPDDPEHDRLRDVLMEELSAIEAELRRCAANRGPLRRRVRQVKNRLAQLLAVVDS